MAFCNLTYTSAIPYREVLRLILESSGIQARQLPVSDILAERQEQVATLIQTWDSELEAKILAENFYLDKSREHRISEINEILDKAGSVSGADELEPENQLRGSFNLNAENGDIKIFFTLTPEKNPKVQHLEVSFHSFEN